MFIVYFADTPTREIRAEEMRPCSFCKKNTLHRYEEISFHSKMLFVKVYCYKRRFMRICSACNNGEEMEKEQFDLQLQRLIMPFTSSGDSTVKKPETLPQYRKSKEKGIRYCRECGEKIYPDIGCCTACAVRGKKKRR